MSDVKKADSPATDAKPASKQAGVSKPRSPGYPFISLEAALNKARDIQKAIGRHEANEDSVYKALGYKGRSGASVVVLAALKAFGLLEGSGRSVKLSTLAMRILLDNREDTTEKQAAIREAALKPVMHAYMEQKYGSDVSSLPSDSVMEYHLVFDKAFTESGAKQFVAEYKATMAFSGPIDSANMTSGGQDDHREEVPMSFQAPPQSSFKAAPNSMTMREVPIPISGTNWPSIKAAFPMSEAAWVQMITVLTAMKPGLVSPESRVPVHDEELSKF
jgi:hypothetical protein